MEKPRARAKRHKSAGEIANIGDSACHPLPPALAAIAAGRDYILTGEFAKVANRASQTIRKNYCTKGACFGIRPLKFGNRLLWPVSQIAALLNGAGPSRDDVASAGAACTTRLPR
jgi:hypothetical protein